MHSPFDIMAETYDADFTYTKIGQMQRQQVWSFLQPLLNGGPKSMKILEINCGTGEDAIKLARLGHTVIATDGSASMIQVASRKAMLDRMENLEFKFCPFSNLTNSFAGQTFDIVISNFGGLNCLDTDGMMNLSGSLAELVTKNGKLVFVIMGNLCLWEIAYYFLKARFGTAFRRRRRSVPFGAGKEQLNIYYYSPARVRKLFRTNYSFKSVYPVGLFVPPSYLEKTFTGRPRLLQQLARIDERCKGIPFLSNFADHYCIIFQKKETV